MCWRVCKRTCDCNANFGVMSVAWNQSRLCIIVLTGPTDVQLIGERPDSRLRSLSKLGTRFVSTVVGNVLLQANLCVVPLRPGLVRRTVGAPSANSQTRITLSILCAHRGIQRICTLLELDATVRPKHRRGHIDPASWINVAKRGTAQADRDQKHSQQRHALKLALK